MDGLTTPKQIRFLEQKGFQHVGTWPFEAARKLTTALKVNNRTTKIALRAAAREAIPNEAYKKKKLGFPVPLREWMHEEQLDRAITEAFESETAAQFFDQKKIIKLLNDYKGGKKDCYKKVWAIYIFLLWYHISFGETD